MLLTLTKQLRNIRVKRLRLGFEIFHDIQEFIVDLRLVGELHFDLKYNRYAKRVNV